MSKLFTADALVRAFAQQVAEAWGALLGGATGVADTTIAPGPGWIATLDVTGASAGRLTVWFEAQSAIACTRAALMAEDVPAESAVADMLREIASQAAGSIGQVEAFEAISIGQATVAPGVMPAHATALSLTFADKPACSIALVADLSATTAAAVDLAHAKLEAVMDVDLPLVVRFGRTVLPLRSLVDLGPGSIVDMGRSPDDPVELLVGERVIAKGEVVIVGGNYGLRITELMNARPGREAELR